MRQALALLRTRAPELELDGEMHADAALSEAIRDRAVPDSRLDGTANLLIMPGLDAANIAFNLLKAAADGLPVGPLLLGMSKPIHVVVPSVDGARHRQHQRDGARGGAAAAQTRPTRHGHVLAAGVLAALLVLMGALGCSRAPRSPPSSASACGSRRSAA